MMLLDGLEPEEFDRLMERFIDREDPNTMSFEALDQAARLQLSEVTTAKVPGNHSLMGIIPVNFPGETTVERLTERHPGWSPRMEGQIIIT